MHGHFASSAQCQAMRSNYHRNRRVSNPHHRVLKMPDHKIKFVIFLLNGIHKHQSQIGTSRKLCPLVSDYKPFIFFFSHIEGFVQSFDHLTPQCIHFGMEFKAEHPVAKIEYGGTRIIPDRIVFSQVIQYDELLFARDGFICFGRYIIILSNAFFHYIKGFISCLQHVVHPLIGFVPCFFHFRYGLLNADGIPYFKRADFPSESCFNRIVNFVQLVCNFRYSERHVFKKTIIRVAVKLSGYIFSRHQHLHPFFQVINRLGGFKGGEFYLLPGFIPEGFQVEGQDLCFPFFLCFLIKTLSGFIAKPVLFLQFFNYFRQPESIPGFVIF